MHLTLHINSAWHTNRKDMARWFPGKRNTHNTQSRLRECDFHPHFSKRKQQDSQLKCGTTEITGETSYTWDSIGLGMGGASHNVLLRTGLFHWSLCHAPREAWNILRVPWCFEQMAGIQFINCRVTLPTRSKDCGIVKENVQHYPEDPHPTSECFSNIWRG